LLLLLHIVEGLDQGLELCLALVDQRRLLELLHLLKLSLLKLLVLAEAMRVEGRGLQVLLEGVLVEVEVHSWLPFRVHEGLRRSHELVHLLLLERYQILKQRLVQVAPGVVL